MLKVTLLYLFFPKYHDRDDLDYYGIKDINLFGDVDVDDDNYYKLILVKSSFKNNHKYYETRGHKDKPMSKAISLQDYAIFK